MWNFSIWTLRWPKYFHWEMQVQKWGRYKDVISQTNTMKTKQAKQSKKIGFKYRNEAKIWNKNFSIGSEIKLFDSALPLQAWRTSVFLLLLFSGFVCFRLCIVSVFAACLLFVCFAFFMCSTFHLLYFLYFWICIICEAAARSLLNVMFWAVVDMDV